MIQWARWAQPANGPTGKRADRQTGRPANGPTDNGNKHEIHKFRSYFSESAFA